MTTKEELYDKLLLVTARSPAIKRKVGAVIVDSNFNIGAQGFNYNMATPNGIPCEDLEGHTLDTVIHAEISCLNDYEMLCKRQKLISKDISLDNSKYLMIITAEPCSGCKAALLAKGIKYEVWKKGPPMEIKAEMQTATSIADTLQQRGSVYGTFKDNSNMTQFIMRVVTTNAKRDLQDFELEALHMIVHKMSRIVCGLRTKKDNWHDIAGYAKLAEDLTKDE